MAALSVKRPGELEVAVVGAGVAGLGLASELARRGHRVVLFERFQTPVPVGAGLLLQPTGLAALARLGQEQSVRGRGHRIDHLYGRSVSGSTVFDIRYDELQPDLHGLAVHRSVLHSSLWKAFIGSSASLECDVEIVDVEQRSGARVSAASATAKKLGPFDLLVDTSGARSQLRQRVDGRSPRPFRYGAVWATVPDSGLAPHALTQRYASARVMMGHLPLGRMAGAETPVAAFFWSLPVREYSQWRAGFDAWRREVEVLWPDMRDVIATLTGPDSLALASYAQFTARRTFRGPVALAGDSAHSTSPQLGQGANQALIDAVVLADALNTHADIGSALADYARRRRNHVRFYQLASALLTPFFQSDSRLLGYTRDIAFHRMGAVGLLRGEMLRTLAGLKTGVGSASPEQIVGG